MWQKMLQGGSGGKQKAVQIAFSGSTARFFVTGIIGEDLTHLKETKLGSWIDEKYQFKVDVHIYRYDFKISSPNNVTDLGTYKAGSSLSANSNQYVYIILEE